MNNSHTKKIRSRLLSFVTKLFQKNSTIFIALSLIFIINMHKGFILQPDSGTYLTNSINRIGLYSLTISLLRYLFADFGLQAVLIFQQIIVIWASYILSTFLKNFFKLPTFIYWSLLCLFMSPAIFAGVANDILSEGLAYPLFLFTSYFFFKGLLSGNIKSLYVFCGFAFLLASTRQQYLLFYCVGFISLIYLSWFHPNFHKKGSYLLALVLSLCSLFCFERMYNYVYHGSFSATLGAAPQFVVRPLFIATTDSYKDFSDPQQRMIVKETMDEIVKNKIVDPDPNKRTLDLYSTTYIPIALAFYNLRTKIWPVEEFFKQISKNDPRFDYKYNQMLDEQTKSIAFTLIKNNITKYASSYFKEVIRGFGGYAFFLATSFLGFIFLWNLLCSPFSFRSEHPLYLSFIFAALINLGNVSIVSFMEPTYVRYSYSTHILLIAMFFILGSKYLSPHSLLSQGNKSD